MTPKSDSENILPPSVEVAGEEPSPPPPSAAVLRGSATTAGGAAGAQAAGKLTLAQRIAAASATLFGAPAAAAPAAPAAEEAAAQIAKLTQERDELRAQLAEAEAGFATFAEKTKAQLEASFNERVKTTAEKRAIELCASQGVPAAELPTTPAASATPVPATKEELEKELAGKPQAERMKIIAAWKKAHG